MTYGAEAVGWIEIVPDDYFVIVACFVVIDKVASRSSCGKIC
jgi:hypothetical protein